MSEARIAALVCEGHTDVPILRSAIQEIWPEVAEVRCLQPELDETERAKAAAGWSQVKAWCTARAGTLAEVLNPDVGEPIDMLVIAIDMDIALEAGIADPPRSVGLYETKRLRQTMTGWLKISPRDKLPDAVVLSTPVMAIEAWIIAALFPKQTNPEKVQNPAAWLMEKGRLMRSPRDGKPRKDLPVYRDVFASAVASKLTRVRKSCAEADRTFQEVERLRKKVESRV